MGALERKVRVGKSKLRDHQMHGFGIFASYCPCRAAPESSSPLDRRDQRSRVERRQASSAAEGASYPSRLRPRHRGPASAWRADRLRPSRSCPAAALERAREQTDSSSSSFFGVLCRHGGGVAASAPDPCGRRAGAAACACGGSHRNKKSAATAMTHRQTGHSVHCFSSEFFFFNMASIIRISARWVLSASVAKLNSSASCPAPAVSNRSFTMVKAPL